MKKVFILLILLIIAVFSIIYRPITRNFKKVQHFSYNSADFIDVKYMDKNYIRINDVKEINQIIEYLNSLELIEEKIPKRKRAEYEGDWKAYENDLRDIGYFSVSINDDLLSFSTHYVTVSPLGCECEDLRTSYYIKGSVFDKESKKINIIDFFESVTDKYTN